MIEVEREAKPGISALGSIPDIVRDFGGPAVAAYTAFFKEGAWKASTRKLYTQNARRFFRWAAARGRSLNAISSNDIADYAAETGSRSGQYLTPVSGVFRKFLSLGVLNDDPFSNTALGAESTTPCGISESPLSIDDLKIILQELSVTEDSKYFQAGLVMLSPLALKTIDSTAISCFTSVPLPLVEEVTGRLLSNRCWSAEGKIVIDSDNPDHWGLAMALNVLVAAGEVIQSPVAEDDTAMPLPGV